MSTYKFGQRALLAAVVLAASLGPVVAHASDTSPAPGTFAAIMAIKDPSHFGPHLPAADLPPKAGCTQRAGSWDAIMSVKDPQHYGPCGRRASQ